MRKIRLLVVAVLVVCFAAVSVFAAEAPAPKKLKAGDVITDFTLPDGLTKTPVAFSKDIKGKSKIIAISFMTTSCSGCKAEQGLLSDLANKYGDDFKVYSVSVDLNGEKNIAIYDKAFGFNVKYLLDPDFKIPQMFGFTYTPSLVIADKEGKIIFMKGGYTASEDADELIKVVKEAVGK